MALRSSASRVLQALHQRGLLLQPARAFSVATSDALDEIYSSARPPTVCILGPPVRAAAEGFGSAARLCFPRPRLDAAQCGRPPDALGGARGRSAAGSRRRYRRRLRQLMLLPLRLTLLHPCLPRSAGRG